MAKMNADQYIDNCRTQAERMFSEEEMMARLAYEVTLLRVLVRQLVMLIGNESEN